MNKFAVSVLVVFSSCLLSAEPNPVREVVSVNPGAAQGRPNIIVVMVDDMGFSDIGCYGGEIETPNLDALAGEGVRFTQFYNTARCSPTRASLLTGLYPHQAGMGYLDGRILPESKGTHGKLHERCVTIAEVLGAAGYHTSMAGKWHLGMRQGCVPWQRGFQRSAVSAYGEVYFPEEKDKEGTKDVYLDGRKVPKISAEFAEGEWYSTFVFNDWGLKFIDEAKQQGKPFFLYMAHGAPHFPLRAPQEMISKYRGRYKEGWDVLRRKRHQRQLAMGLVRKEWPLIERPGDVRAWDSLTDQERDRFDAIMAVYAAMIDCVDQSVGKLIAGLKERGLYENTLILFLSDNGGNAEGGPDGITRGDSIGGPFSDVFLGMSWATMSNTPFRRYKHFTHEGGVSTPLIAHWPAGIEQSRYGKLEHQPGHLIDIMATAVDLARAEYPEKFKGHDILPMEGASLVPAFKGEPLKRTQPIFWEHEGNRAIRQGPWKLVMKLGGQWELYNIEEDRTEQNDLAEKMPEMAKAMAALWESWAARSFVDQWPDERRTDWGHVIEPEPEAVTPQIGMTPFEVAAVVESAAPEGVVMAQGGLRFGFSLYFKEGRPAFAYRNDGQLLTITGTETVKGRIEMKAVVDNESLILSVNGKEVARCASSGVLKELPGLGLFIGLDGVHPVGEYEVPNRFNGRILEHAVRPQAKQSVMLTPWGEKVTPENAWREYPRPAMKRDNWTCLNGLWQYAVTKRDAERMPAKADGDILVPYAIESALSGVRKSITPDDALWYKRVFDVAGKTGKRLLLNFEAVDYDSEIRVNGREIGRHVGGNLPFSFDISEAVKSGTNELVVKVLDATDTAYQLHGKQRLTPKGIWYTPVSGIWQSVWLEEVPEIFIRDVRIAAKIDGTLDIKVIPSAAAPDRMVQVTASLQGNVVASVNARADAVRLKIPDPLLWSPETPNIYDLAITLGDDTVKCYTGIREVGRRKDKEGHWRFTLNGEEIFHWGPLDQGWWPDGLLTPPSDKAMRSDIEFLKAAGFNMIRKHIKVEPRRYYYHCDRIGMMMWQDQVSAMSDNPKWTRLKADPETRVWPEAAHKQYMAELKGMIDSLHNHPCIVQWVPFNEAWGQHQTEEVGKWVAGYDPTRHVNIASGGNWFPVGDIVDHHQYPHPGFPFELGEGGRFDNYIKVVGEFGGHGFPVEGHLWNPGARNWGYGGLPKDKNEWLERYQKSIDMLAELKKKGIAGGVYTQTTDVEGEINGLITYDRKVHKMPTAKLARISQRLFEGDRKIEYRDRQGRERPKVDEREVRAGLESHDRALYIKTGWIRDPYIVLSDDGWYYLTGTTPNPDRNAFEEDVHNTGLGEGSTVGYFVRIWRSRDLVEWEYTGEPFDLTKGYWAGKEPKAFEGGPQPGWHLWAPEVHFVKGRWCIVHTTPGPVGGGSNLALTAGDEIKGPYTFPLGDLSRHKHDPSLFQDDGRVYLLWGNTMITQLKKDLSGFVFDPVRIDPAGSRMGVFGDRLTRIGHEGATMRKIGGKYVYFGTAWSTDMGRRGSYNLYYCTADNITGPYGERRFAGRFLGHGTPFQDKQGRWWCTAFYNANVPPVSRDYAHVADLSYDAYTINPQGVTIVPLDVQVGPDGDVTVRAKDPDYAMIGADENGSF